MSEELNPEMTNDSVKLFLEYMIGVRELFNELDGDPKVILAKSLPALFEHLAEALELMPSDETLRASLAPVDIEGLKRECHGAASARCTHAQHPYKWIDAAIDHLAARGFFGVGDVMCLWGRRFNRCL